ncbi:hypothetical protein TWF694_005965 [Orbilia ellipsospora]|uniref:Uncharacterized protein n=1 Tax=Orbilia ellipsospora TaxID=2528407 RepID=A0AAV9WYI7_9PEZI
MSHGRFSPRAFTMPLAAFTMAGILLVYTRSSIHRAKQDTQMRRRPTGDMQAREASGSDGSHLSTGHTSQK